MLFLFNADRRLAKLAADAAHIESVGRVRDRPWRRTDTTPSASTIDSHPDVAAGARDATDAQTRSDLTCLLQIAIVGEPETLRDALTEDAHGWSPTFEFSSCAEAEAAFRERDRPLMVQQFRIDRMCWSANVVFAEWSLRASLRTPLLVADDILVEADDRDIALGGATVAVRCGALLSSVHTYFDDATLIEQVVLGP